MTEPSSPSSSPKPAAFTASHSQGENQSFRVSLVQSIIVLIDGVPINIIKLQDISISDHHDLGFFPGDWGKDYLILFLTDQQAAAFLKDRSFWNTFPKRCLKRYKLKYVAFCGYLKMAFLQHPKQRAQSVLSGEYKCTVPYLKSSALNVFWVSGFFRF